MDTSAPVAQATAVVIDHHDAAISDAVLDAAVAHLRELAHVALVEFAIAAGRYIVETFYDGRLGDFHDRSRFKHTSFNALCERRADELAAIGLSQTTLRRYVNAYDAWRQLPGEARAQLSLRTLELLRKVPDPVARTELALAAAREGWSPRKLIAKVEAKAEAYAPPPSKRGRPRLLPGEKALRGLVRQARAIEQAREAIAALPPARLAAMRKDLQKALALVEDVLGDGSVGS